MNSFSALSYRDGLTGRAFGRRLNGNCSENVKSIGGIPVTPVQCSGTKTERAISEVKKLSKSGTANKNPEDT